MNIDCLLWVAMHWRACVTERGSCKTKMKSNTLPPLCYRPTLPYTHKHTVHTLSCHPPKLCSLWIQTWCMKQQNWLEPLMWDFQRIRSLYPCHALIVNCRSRTESNYKASVCSLKDWFCSRKKAYCTLFECLCVNYNECIGRHYHKRPRAVQQCIFLACI